MMLIPVPSYVGRVKEMIRKGGENITVLPIESAISKHPAVIECVCVDVLEEYWKRR